MGGYVNISRDILTHPVVCKDAINLAIMVWLIREAAYTEHEVWFGNKTITIKPGQLVTGRRVMSEQLNVQQMHIERTLKLFESAQLIEQQANSRGRLISLLFMASEEKSEQQSEQQVNNKCSADVQQMNSKVNHTELNNTTKGTKVTNETKEVEVVAKATPSRRKSKQPAFDPEPLIESAALPEPVKDSTREWVQYKAERRDKYTETGFSRLLAQIQKCVQTYGSDAFINATEMSMANGYQGIVWPKARSSPTARAAPGSADDYLMRVARGEA